jgi:hypothetical protein
VNACPLNKFSNGGFGGVERFPEMFDAASGVLAARAFAEDHYFDGVHSKGVSVRLTAINRLHRAEAFPVTVGAVAWNQDLDAKTAAIKLQLGSQQFGAYQDASDFEIELRPTPGHDLSPSLKVNRGATEIEWLGAKRGVSRSRFRSLGMYIVEADSQQRESEANPAPDYPSRGEA